MRSRVCVPSTHVMSPLVRQKSVDCGDSLASQNGDFQVQEEVLPQKNKGESGKRDTLCQPLTFTGVHRQVHPHIHVCTQKIKQRDSRLTFLFTGPASAGFLWPLGSIPSSKAGPSVNGRPL